MASERCYYLSHIKQFSFNTRVINVFVAYMKLLSYRMTLATFL